MKQGWEIKKLGEVCELSAGGDVPKDYFSEIQTEKYQIPIYANGEKNEGLYGYTTIAKIVKPSITVSARGTIGFSVKRLEPFFPIVRLIVVSPIDLKKLSLDFLDYALRKIDFKHSGSSIPQLTVPMIRDYEIPLPPLPEQQRIVSILDECFAAIDKAMQNAKVCLSLSKALFESYLQGVFDPSTRSGQGKGDGWEIKTLGEVSKINYGYTEKASFEDVGPKFLRITDIQENGVDWETVPYCKCSDKDLPKYKLETGDIVFARTGATTGKSYLINNPPNSVFASYLIRLRMNSINEFIPEFISYFFQTKTYWGKINAGISGSAQGGFNATKLGELEFHFPKSKEEQQTIVRHLDALRSETQKLEAVYQKKIADLEELKKSVLERAFSGQMSELGFVGLHEDKIVGDKILGEDKNVIVQSSKLKHPNPVKKHKV
jgi:type I restriction enzyme S subunit